MNNYDDIFNPSTPQFEDKPFDKNAWSEQKQAERQEVYSLADATVESISQNGENFQGYLDVQAKFDRYSVTNVLLITAQMPQATQLRDFDSWRENDVSIKRQEKGIRILEPGNEYTREDGSVGVSYNIKKVFDISQTTTRIKVQPTVNRDDRLLLKALINRAPVPIQPVDEVPNQAGAYYDHNQQIILVQRGMDAQDIFRNVSKELAHAEMAVGRDDYSRENTGFNAYCASYLLCKKNGIDVRGYDFRGLPDTIREADPQKVRAELTEIKETVDTISTKMAKVLEQNKAPRQKEQER